MADATGRLAEQLWGVEVPSGSRARARALAIARREAAGYSTAPAGARPTLLPVLIAIIAVVVAAALTPPGREAVSWAADLVGIGEVGGPPTLDQSSQPIPPSSEAIVFATGTTPDGQRFEVVGYGSDSQRMSGPASCVSLQRPDAGALTRLGATCYSGGPTEEGLKVMGASFPHPRADGGSYATIDGEANASTRRVEVTYVDDEGAPHRTEATLAVLDGELGRRIGVTRPTVFFFAFLPGATDVSRLDDYRISAVGYDGEGHSVGTDEIRMPGSP